MNKQITTRRNKTSILILLVATFLLSLSLTTAANIGISPAKVSFEKVLRGGYAETIITVTIDSDDEHLVEVSKRGEIEDWLNYTEESFTVSKSTPHRFTISTSPPSDTPNGNYTGFIRVRISNTQSQQIEGHATGIVTPVLDLYTVVEVTDIEFKECKADQYNVNSVEEGDDIIFSTEVLNLGNIRLNPKIKIDIWDQDQIEILESHEFSNIQVAPTTKERLLLKVPSTKLKRGQYWVDISAVDCYSSQTLTFDILEEGALRASGILEKILSAPWVNPKETTLIEAFFRNNGEKNLNARFKGKITKGDKTVQLIETEKQTVLMNELSKFEFYFTPQESGRYVISGRVIYDSKKTFEKSAIINVHQVGLNYKLIGKYLIYILLIAGITYLTFKIRQERKSIQKKIRRFKR